MLNKLIARPIILLDAEEIDVEGPCYSTSKTKFGVGKDGEQCVFKLIETKWKKNDSDGLPYRGITLVGSIFKESGKGKSKTVETRASIHDSFVLSPNPHADYKDSSKARLVYEAIADSVKSFIITNNRFPTVGNSCGKYTLQGSDPHG